MEEPQDEQLVDSSKPDLPPAEAIGQSADPDAALPPQYDPSISSSAERESITSTDSIETKIGLKAMKDFSEEDKTLTMSALAALQNYLAAASWEERIPLARRGSIDKGRIRNYYADKEPGPIIPLSIEFVSINTKPDSALRFLIFHVRTREIPEGFPVIIDDENGEPKVAWRIFAELHDDLLADFISGWRSEPESFHVYMNRKHYLANDVPDLDSLACFLIETPVPGRKAYVFVKKDSELSKDLANQIPWGSRGHPVVQLQWTRGSDGRAFIQIQNIKRYGWGED